VNYECPVEELDAEDPLFYFTPLKHRKAQSSPPLHSRILVGGGHHFKKCFDIHNGDFGGCTGDIGWITGHSYLI
jgi:acetyl-CoA synthetase